MSKQLKKHMFALQWAARWLHKILVQKNYQGLKDKCSRAVERQWRHGFCEEFVQPPCGAFGGSGTCHNRSIPSAACEPRQPWVSHRFRRKKRYWFLSEKPPTTRGHRNRRPSSSLLRWRGCVYGDFWAAVNLFDSKRGRHATSFGCFRWNFPLKKKRNGPFSGSTLRSSTVSGGKGRAPTMAKYGPNVSPLEFSPSHHGIFSLTSGHQKGPPMMSDDESCSDSSKRLAVGRALERGVATCSIRNQTIYLQITTNEVSMMMFLVLVLVFYTYFIYT